MLGIRTFNMLFTHFSIQLCNKWNYRCFINQDPEHNFIGKSLVILFALETCYQLPYASTGDTCHFDRLPAAANSYAFLHNNTIFNLTYLFHHKIKTQFNIVSVAMNSHRM